MVMVPKGDRRPWLWDLCCGGGGAAKGYADAGFKVKGFDIEPQPDYPYTFEKADAIEVLDALAAGDLPMPDAIHASPPCQLFTRAKHLRDAQGGEASALNLIPPTRDRLRRLGVPYVIENVPGAPLHGVTLCGSSFGLKVRRHRVFESNVYIPPLACDHKAQGRPVGVYHVLNDNIPKGGRTAETLEQAREAMGINWLPWDSLKEAIPPAYTRYIGEHLVEAVRTW